MRCDLCSQMYCNCRVGVSVFISDDDDALIFSILQATVWQMKDCAGRKECNIWITRFTTWEMTLHRPPAGHRAYLGLFTVSGLKLSGSVGAWICIQELHYSSYMCWWLCTRRSSSSAAAYWICLLLTQSTRFSWTGSLGSSKLASWQEIQLWETMVDCTESFLSSVDRLRRTGLWQRRQMY